MTINRTVDDATTEGNGHPADTKVRTIGINDIPEVRPSTTFKTTKRKSRPRTTSSRFGVHSKSKLRTLFMLASLINSNALFYATFQNGTYEPTEFARSLGQGAVDFGYRWNTEELDTSNYYANEEFSVSTGVFDTPVATGWNTIQNIRGSTCEQPQVSGIWTIITDRSDTLYSYRQRVNVVTPPRSSTCTRVSVRIQNAVVRRELSLHGMGLFLYTGRASLTGNAVWATARCEGGGKPVSVGYRVRGWCPSLVVSQIAPSERGVSVGVRVGSGGRCYGATLEVQAVCARLRRRVTRRGLRGRKLHTLDVSYPSEQVTFSRFGREGRLSHRMTCPSGSKVGEVGYILTGFCSGDRIAERYAISRRSGVLTMSVASRSAACTENVRGHMRLVCIGNNYI